MSTTTESNANEIDAEIEKQLLQMPGVHALAGAGGSTLAFALTYPLITVSTRLQVQKKQDSGLKWKPYVGTLDALTRIPTEEGIKALYAGLQSGLFGVAVTSGVYYYWYQFFRGFFEGNGPQKALSNTANLIVASLAGGVTAVVTNPLWVVNTQMQVSKSNLTTAQTAKQLFQESGIAGFFKGIIPALILVSNPAIQYVVFEKLRTDFQNSGKKLTGFHIFLIGAIAKAIATVVTYPYVVVKSRMQVQKEGQKQTTMQIFQTIAKEEGFWGYYRGMDARLLSSVSNAAFMFLFKEELTTVTVKTLLFLIKLFRGNKK